MASSAQIQANFSVYYSFDFFPRLTKFSVVQFRKLAQIQ